VLTGDCQDKAPANAAILLSTSANAPSTVVAVYLPATSFIPIKDAPLLVSVLAYCCIINRSPFDLLLISD